MFLNLRLIIYIYSYDKISTLSQKEVTDKLIKEMANFMLSMDKREPTYLDKE